MVPNLKFTVGNELIKTVYLNLLYPLNSQQILSVVFRGPTLHIYKLSVIKVLLFRAQNLFSNYQLKHIEIDFLRIFFLLNAEFHSILSSLKVEKSYPNNFFDCSSIYCQI